MRAVTGQGQVGLRRASDGSGGHWGCRNRVERDLPHVAVLHEQHVLDLGPVRSFLPGNMHRTVQADSQLHRRTVDTLNEHTELSQLGLGATQILADGGLPRPTTRNLRGPRNLALEQLPHRIQRRPLLWRGQVRQLHLLSSFLPSFFFSFFSFFSSHTYLETRT